MNELLLVPLKDTEILTEINCPEVCSNAKYIFDHPLLWLPRDRLKIANGQVFLIRANEEMLIDGRWAVVSR